MEHRIQFVSSYLEGVVAVRTVATKIVDREDELIELGLPSDYLASGDRVTIAESETVLRAIIEGVDLVESFDSR